MEARELRIGNLVDYYGNIVTINSINDNDVGFSDYVPVDYPLLEEINPIPITEDWLVKLGFELIDYDLFGEEDQDEEICLVFKIQHPKFKTWKLGVDLFVDDKHCQLYLILDDKLKDDYILYHSFIKHIHQLQNLFFALTGEELELKQTDK